MFAKIENGQVVQWPIPNLAVLLPNTSFPSPLTDADLPEGYVSVGVIAAPQVEPTQKVTPGQPIFQDGKWVQGWDVVDMTQAEINERTEVRAADVRAERNQRLSACDWTQLADAPVDKAAWSEYRQALRDITAQPGFPLTTVWPDQPA